MTESTLQAQINAAHAYESLFVPALFGQYAPVVVDAAHIQSGERVLDVACGTGILARAAASRVTPAGYVAGVDPGPGMLAVARQLAPAVDWREGVAESLPFPDQSFDAVVSQFGLMFFTDQPRALREMLRVLKPTGRLSIAVWDSLDNNPAYAAEAALFQQLAGASAADAVRAPFVLGDKRALAASLANAGADSVQATTHPGTARFPSIHVMVEADLRGWLPVMGVNLPGDVISRILQQAPQALAAFTSADGAAVFDVSAHIITAHKISPMSLRTE